ncbi:[LSU ribosomal protein L11P]-lysine N-methyltransferase [Sulfurivirga caldicuralii]|uniref:Ribosomal protein L11 methyltransferase n=1 Tax=Sulfurivirga caldicuralii TaxID=364032 RepID=A0A1N6GCX1_9GAMM|nr:50S ribosomal protein L11 methyltransferase [Sulfurivirga caldicuralii]SIO05336.1 [LSU ribosomal protein L11P]-lysine N-methyltransferase [Sulfurivirga caldicuralii]
MSWIQITAQVPEAQVEPLSEALMAQGALSVTQAEGGGQEIFEPDLGTTPLWQQTHVTGLFSADVDGKAIVQALKHALPVLKDTPFKVEILEDKDWVRAWMDQFQPMRFGERLWIVPSWCEPPETDAVNLLLDPGMAFGTGTHPTTAMCLRWLDAHPPAGQQVIDYGCGSGVLAIAATKLGAQAVYGTDIDPQAILASEENARRNDVTIDFRLVKDFEAAPPQPADLVMANILAGPLKELAPTLAQHLKPGGSLILSGLLTEQAADLIQHYANHGIVLTLHDEQDNWTLLAGQKRG